MNNNNTISLYIKMLIFSVLIIFISCSKNDAANSSNEFFEVTINGQKFREELSPRNYSGFDNQTTCDGKRGYLLNIWDGNVNSKYELNTDIIHYQTEADFKSIKPGNFIFSTGNNTCNFSFGFSLYDKSLQNSQTSLSPGSTHAVSSITLISTSANRKEYLISGNFTANFKNNSNAVISISGNYQKSIEILP